MRANKKMSPSEKDELKALLASIEIDAHKMSIVVETIFRKATAEKLFVGFYATLCAEICATELKMKGWDAKRINA